MARLPDLNALGARPVPVNRQGIATQDTSAAGRGMAQFGAVISQVGEEISKKNDEQAIFEARRKTTDWERRKVYDPENGVVSKRGIDAVDLPNKVLAEYDTFIGEIGKGLTTNRQRQVFQEMAESRRNQVADFTIRHATTQKEVYEKGQLAADVESSSDRAVMLASNGDVGGAKAELDTVALRMTSFMKQRGASGEEIANAIKTNSSRTHAAIVASLVDKDPDAAKAYYYSNKKGITGVAQAELEKAIDRGGMLQKAQEAADEISVKYPDIGSAMAYIEKTFSGETEREVKAQVASRYTTAKAAKNEMSQSAYETALLHTVQNKPVPTVVWSQMDDGHKAAIIEKREAEAKARRVEAEGRAVKTDFTTWDGLNRMSSADPKAFAALDIGRYADRLSRADMEEFGKLQKRVRDGGPAAKDVVLLAQQIDVTLDTERLKANTPENAALRKSIHDALVAEQQATGKELTYEDRQKVIDRQVMRVAVPGFLWGTNEKPAYQLTPTERAKAKVVVPENDRKLISDALKSKGRIADEAAILDLYKRQKGLQ